MKRLLLFVLIIMGFCGRFASDAKRCPVAQVVVEPVEPLLVRPVQDDMQCRLWVDSVLDRLSLKERVGQLFIYTDEEALTYAIRLFKSIEQYSFDSVKNGYCEALTRDWNDISDMRLSDKDENERKTMNTHLHILEPYTNLYRVWKDAVLEKQLRNLIELFTDKILNQQTGHLELFFDDDWVSKYRIISYGHDIEASWLIHEAALVLGDKALLEKVEPLVEYIAAAADEGLTSEGGMIYETFPDKGTTDRDCHWWVQAENVVGHINLYQHFDDEVALQKASRCWEYIKKHLIDYKNGEWYWSVRADGTVNTADDKAGFWKCPYHNGRMCMEMIERFS